MASLCTTTVKTLVLCVFALVVCLTEGWVMSRCEEDSECTVTDAQCYRGHCVCAPGYYYSQTNKTCVSACSQEDLVDGYTPYPGSSMEQNDIGVGFNTTDLEPCLLKCGQTPECRAVVFRYATRTCYLKDRSVTDVGVGNWSTDSESSQVIMLQRRCA